MQCNNPIPVDNETSATTKKMVRTARKKVARTQEYTFRELPVR